MIDNVKVNNRIVVSDEVGAGGNNKIAVQNKVVVSARKVVNGVVKNGEVKEAAGRAVVGREAAGRAVVGCFGYSTLTVMANCPHKRSPVRSPH
jgi:hypothetical protein